MDKIQRNPEQISRVVRATLKGVRFLKNNKPETLAIMRDYLKISGDYVEKIYQFAMRSLNEDGLVAKNSLDNEIRLAREQLKIKEEIPESKVAEWKFIKEILAKRSAWARQDFREEGEVVSRHRPACLGGALFDHQNGHAERRPPPPGLSGRSAVCRPEG